jgi:pseudouridine-5'-phosphate glycosidase
MTEPTSSEKPTDEAREKALLADAHETAIVMFRSTLALHGMPSSHAVCIAMLFAARMAEEAGVPAEEATRLFADEYARAKASKEKPCPARP